MLKCFVIVVLGGSLAVPAMAENLVRVSWGDHIVVGRGIAKLDTPDKIRTAVRRWKRLPGVRGIIWRVSAVALKRDFVFNPNWRGSYRRTSEEIFKRFDPLKTVVHAAHAEGLKIYAWHTIFDEGCPPNVLYGGHSQFPWQSKFTRAHPEYLVVDRTGQRRHWGVLEYAYPEVRRYKIGQFRWFMDHYDFDGVYVCTRSHSLPADSADEFGFNVPVVAAFRQRYGKDIRREEFDREAWRRLRGEFQTQFFRELRAALPDRVVFAAIPRGRYLGPPYGNMYLDWETWAREGLVDGLVVGVVSGKWLHPNEKRTDREKGYLSSQEEGIGVGTAREDVERVYAPVCARYRRRLFYGMGSPGDADFERPWRGLTGWVCSSMGGRLRLVQAFVADHSALALANARFTIEFRLFLRRYTDWPRVLSKYDHTRPDDAGRGWEVMVSKDGRIVLRLNDGGRDWTLASKGRVPERRWTHVACVSEGRGGKLRIYINGRADSATAPAPARVRRTPVRLYFGEYGSGASVRRLDGLLDEVRLVDRPLAFARVPSEPYTGREPGTVALWHFDAVNDGSFPSRGPVAGLCMRLTGFGGNAPPAQSLVGFGRAYDVQSP